MKNSRRSATAFALVTLAALSACRRTETATTHYPTGELWTIRRYAGGVPIDPWIVLWPGDSTRHEQFFDADGARVGRWRTASPRGELLLERHYEADELHGAWRRYLPGGVLVEDGTFTRGRRTGTWRTFAADGTLLATEELDAR
jgi:hypothetical protein